MVIHHDPASHHQVRLIHGKPIVVVTAAEQWLPRIEVNRIYHTGNLCCYNTGSSDSMNAVINCNWLAEKQQLDVTSLVLPQAT